MKAKTSVNGMSTMFRSRSVEWAVHHFSFSLVNTDSGYVKGDFYVDLCRAVDRYYRYALNDTISLLKFVSALIFDARKVKVSP